MKDCDVVVLRNCYRATVTARAGNTVAKVRIHPTEYQGEKIILAMMLHPVVAYAYETGNPLAVNPFIALQDSITEPSADDKAALTELFRELGMVFVTPADLKAISEQIGTGN